MKCDYCSGKGQITILIYRDLKTKKISDRKSLADCPRCGGTGKKGE